MNGRKPLLAFLALVAVLWLLFEQHDSSRTENRVLLTCIGILFAICVVIMLIWVEEWHLRAIGVFGAVAGTSLLYFYLARPPDGWIIGHTIPESLIRAFFVAGGVTLFAGQVWFVRDRFLSRRRKRDMATGYD